MVRLITYPQPRAMTEFRSQFSQLLDQLFGRDVSGDGGEVTTWFSPSANIAETDSEFKITIELPGLQPDDVDIEIDNGNLWVSGERQEEREERGQTWHRVERQFGQFRRVFTLGTKIQPGDVDAEFRDGILHISVKKTEPSRRRIDVRESLIAREKIAGSRSAVGVEQENERQRVVDEQVGAEQGEMPMEHEPEDAVRSKESSSVKS